MKDEQITCPHCQRKFPLSEVMRHEIEESVKSEFETQREQLEAEHKTELERIKAETERSATAKAEKSKLVEIQSLKEQVTELEEKQTEFNQKELDYLKREREIKAKESQLELEKQKFVNEKTEELQSTIREVVESEMMQKIAEKEKKIERLEQLAKELQKKASQGSMEEQGEAFEQGLEDFLRDAFRSDEFEPVLKGKRGADIIHKVKTNSQKTCGTIVWEAKYTGNWKEDWVTKLKEDQRRIGGDTVGIIVTNALPKGLKHFGFHNGVWVTDFHCIVGLATSLRAKFLEIFQTKASVENRSAIQDLIYDYLTGPDFKKRIEATGEALKDMRLDIERERNAYEKNLARRETQLLRVAKNMAGFYGDLSGLGAQLQSVPTLELESGDM